MTQNTKQEISNKDKSIKAHKATITTLQNEIIAIKQQNENKDRAIQAQQVTNTALANEIIALKQQLNEQHVEEKKQDEDNNLKQDLSSITSKINEFNGKYNLERISNIYDNDPNALSVDVEIDEADISSKSMIKKLQDIKGYIDEITKIDITRYEKWDINDTMKWIKSLNEGQFNKYLDVLRQGFVSDGIAAADLPSIVAADLATDPFNIRSFGDRKKLVHHFKSLDGNIAPIDNQENDEGAVTEYH